MRMQIERHSNGEAESRQFYRGLACTKDKIRTECISKDSVEYNFLEAIDLVRDHETRGNEWRCQIKGEIPRRSRSRAGPKEWMIHIEGGLLQVFVVEGKRRSGGVDQPCGRPPLLANLGLI
jgi:hypothetical protein